MAQSDLSKLDNQLASQKKFSKLFEEESNDEVNFSMEVDENFDENRLRNTYKKAKGKLGNMIVLKYSGDVPLLVIGPHCGNLIRAAFPRCFLSSWTSLLLLLFESLQVLANFDYRQCGNCNFCRLFNLHRHLSEQSWN